MFYLFLNMAKYTLFFFFLFFNFLFITSGNSQDLSDAQQKEVNKQAEVYLNKGYSIYKSNARDQESLDTMTASFSKANTLFKRLDNTIYSIYTFHLLFDLYQIERSYQKMDQVTQDALSIAEEKLGKNHPYLGSTLNIRGISVYENKKDYNNAIAYFKQCKEINRHNKVSLLEISNIDFNLSECYLYTGDYDQAIKYSENALTIQIDSANWNTKLISKLYNQLGLCFSKKKQPTLATTNFKKGINAIQKIKSTQREIDQILLYLYQNISAHLLENNQLDLAHEYINKAIKLQENKAFIKDAYTFEILGNIFLKEDKKEKALNAFQQSSILAKLEYKNFDQHPEVGNTYVQTANAWLTQNEIDSAFHYFQSAIVHHSTKFNLKDFSQNPSIEDLINPLSAIDILEGKAKAFLKKHQLSGNIKDLEFAFNNYNLAIEAIAKTRRSFNAEGSKHILSEKVNSIYENAIETSFILFNSTDNQEWLERGFEIAESNKAAALLEAIQENEALTTTGIPDSLLQEEYNLKVDIAFYEKLIYEAQQNKEESAPKKIKELTSKRFELDETYRLLIDHFETNYPEYFTLKFKPQKINLKEVQTELKDEAILEFFVGEKNIFVITITHGDISFEKTAKTGNFESDINVLRKIISSPPSSKKILAALSEFNSISNRLYNTLLASSIKGLPSSIKKLVIIPDDILAYIPFSIFVETENLTDKNSFKTLGYLSNKFTISYNYSTALWTKFSNQKLNNSNNKFIGFAPDFSRYQAEEKLSPLSCNTTEIQAISKLLKSPNAILNTDATLQDFKTRVKDYQIIHLATHTSLDNENSAFNKIYFSDHYLNQNDLYQLNLDASLVVLSACNTGFGELKKGEGIMSLSRGFTHAGCPSVLMSLWSVDDCATADVMLEYYKGLEDGKTKDEALHLAKNNYLKETEDLLQAHPYYWAGFVQHGNIKPINPADSFFYIVPIAGILLLFLFVLWFKKK